MIREAATVYGCETYPDWLRRVLRAGALDELRRRRRD